MSEKLQPDAGPDMIQGGPACPVSSNHRQMRTQEGRGPAHPVPRGTGASGHAPRRAARRAGASGHVRPDTSDRVRSSLDSDRTLGAARPVKQ
jgi:hypothetical protein